MGIHSYLKTCYFSLGHWEYAYHVVIMLISKVSYAEHYWWHIVNISLAKQSIVSLLVLVNISQALSLSQCLAKQSIVSLSILVEGHYIEWGQHDSWWGEQKAVVFTGGRVMAPV